MSCAYSITGVVAPGKTRYFSPQDTGTGADLDSMFKDISLCIEDYQEHEGKDDKVVAVCNVLHPIELHRLQCMLACSDKTGQR